MFSLTRKFGGWATKPEQTNMNVEFLGPEAKNVLVDFANRIVSRGGMEVYGALAGANAGPVRGSYEWDTSVSRQVSLKSHYDYDLGGVIEFSHEDAYYTLKSGLSGADMECAEWWDSTNRIANLLIVLGDKNIYRWGGGVAKVQSNTAATITLQGVLTGKTTIAFNAAVPTVSPATITDSANGFLDAGFAVGDNLIVSGSAANSRTFTIASVTAGTIELIASNILTTEGAGPAITLTNGTATWNAAGAGFMTTGSIVVNGTEYSYTGGANSDTLTGLAGLPAIPVGTVVWQAVTTHANPAAIDSFFINDLIGVEGNQVWLGSRTSRDVYISDDNDFTNFTIPGTRAAGDPAVVRMDNYTTKIITLDNTEQSASNSNLSAAIVCGGTSDFVKLEFRMSADNSTEVVKARKMKASNLSGVFGRGTICNTHQGVVYISNEPVMDFLDTVEMPDHQPISDIIKPNFDSYDFTDAHLLYLSRAVGVAIPREGIVLIYDLMRKLWHAPMYFAVPIARLGVLKDGSIIGHSALDSTTYKLFTGTNDLGGYIQFVVDFPYANKGDRASENKFSRYWTDGYITANGELVHTLKKGFAGSAGIETKTILGTDVKTVQQPGGDGLGQQPLGFNPFGGAPLEAQTNLLRLRVVKKFVATRQTEYKSQYEMDTLDGQFAIVAHGPEFIDDFDESELAGITID